MSWTSFEQLLSKTPQLRDVATRVAGAFATARDGVDPLLLAMRLGVDGAEVLATVGLLLQAGLGTWVVQVNNSRGQMVREFESLESTPPFVYDDYGDRIVVEPANTRIVFRPSRELNAATA